MQSTEGVSKIDKLRAEARRAAFEALYSRFAWAYDWVSGTFFLGQWRRWQRAALPFLVGPRVLEVGMGTGNLQFDLARAGFEASGIDLSPQMLRQASRKAHKRGFPLRACRARAQALPFPNGSFDSVVSTFPSEYIISPETLNEIARTLRPGGRLVIVPAGSLRPVGARSVLFEVIARLVYGDKAARPLRQAQTGEIHSKLEGSGWVKMLGARMAEASFQVSGHVATNDRGAALVIVGTKKVRWADSNPLHVQ